MYLLLLSSAVFSNPLQSQTAAERQMDSLRVEYIRKYKDIAMDEMERSGIPASIKLAQGILESRAGTSLLATKTNNHFGIKCGKSWNGERYSKFDDERDKQGRPVQSCFRKYDNVVECFADHSDFIRNPEKAFRYGFLLKLDPRDYKGWAEGLQEAGYSSVNFYAEKLIYYIELHGLHEYDLLAYNGRVSLKRLSQVNELKMIQARSAETLSDIARMYNLPLAQLLAFNDNQYGPEQALSQGSWVYMQAKRDSWSGPETFHQVSDGQNLFDIAQRYGIRLEKLQQLNGLKPGETPVNYEYIRLRGQPIPGEKVLTRQPISTAAQPEKPKNTTAKSPETTGSGYVIEMLPETRLDAPIPMYRADETLTSALPEFTENYTQNPEPLIIIDTQTGETRIFHTVREGETLYSIARRYKISTENLRQLNQIKDNVVRPGQSLRVE